MEKKLVLVLFCVMNIVNSTTLAIESNMLSDYNDMIQMSSFSKLFAIEMPSFNISEDCGFQLNLFIKGFKAKEVWALRMFDATSKMQSGILDGNIYNLGSYDECMSIYNEPISNDTDDNQLISGKYCLGNLGTSSLGPLNAASWSICAPDKCSSDDLNEIMSSLGMSVQFNEVQCHTKSQDPEITDGDIAVIVCSSVILLIMIASSLYDIYLYYAQKEAWNPLFLAFSVISNGKKLFSTGPQSSDQLSCLAGIRAISMMWIILGHLHSIFASVAISNTLALVDFFNSGWTMYIRSATVSVDTFFLMSGIVMIYVYMKITKKNQVWFNVFQYYLHRYLRLTPALAAVIVVHVTLLKHFGDGPFWHIMDGYGIDNCIKYWWSALLYIQNYVNSYEMCVGQSWYLSVDTQLFFLSPLCLIPLRRWPRITLAAVLVAACASTASGFAVAWIYKLKDMNSVDSSAADSKRYMTKFYTATYARAAPWLIGIIVGYIIYNVKLVQKNFKISKVLNIAMWIASMTVMLTILFYDNVQDDYNRAAISSYIAFVRPAWSIALSWVIFACVTGYGGPINGFLSLPIFQILARLSYTMYITHYTTLLVYFLSIKSPMEFSTGKQMYSFWSAYALIFAISTVWTLTFESPIIIIEKALRGNNRKVEKQTNQSENKISPQILPENHLQTNDYINNSKGTNGHINNQNSNKLDDRNPKGIIDNDNIIYGETNGIQNGIENRSYESESEPKQNHNNNNMNFA